MGTKPHGENFADVNSCSIWFDYVCSFPSSEARMQRELDGKKHCLVERFQKNTVVAQEIELWHLILPGICRMGYAIPRLEKKVSFGRNDVSSRLIG